MYAFGQSNAEVENLPGPPGPMAVGWSSLRQQLKSQLEFQLEIPIGTTMAGGENSIQRPFIFLRKFINGRIGIC